MNRLKRLCRLSPSDWPRLARAALLTLACDAALRLRPFPAVQRWVASRAREAEAKLSAEQIDKLAWSVGAAGGRLGPMGSCLRQALALQWLLARRGEASTLWLGADKRSEGFAAHAWLEDASGRVLIGGPADDERFAALRGFTAPLSSDANQGESQASREFSPS